MHDSLLVGRYLPNSTTGKSTVSVDKRLKVAALDLVSNRSFEEVENLRLSSRLFKDSTIIQTVSGNVHPKDAQDWRWWHRSVPGAIKQLYADGYE